MKAEVRKELTVRVAEETAEQIRDACFRLRLSQQELLTQAITQWMGVNHESTLIDPHLPKNDDERLMVKSLLNVLRCRDLDSIGVGLREMAISSVVLADKHVRDVEGKG